jgi:hypothetical protein
MENSRGIAGNNIVTVLMENKNIDIQDASDEVGEYFQKLMAHWTDARTRLPSWGRSIDRDVARYIEATGHWVRGNLEYVLECFFSARFSR